jgi:selenocysteine lyase/cysteine desulfurase
MLDAEGLTTGAISAHVRALQEELLASIGRTSLANAELLNPLDGAPHARFLAFRDPNAQRWYEQLKTANCITDVRGEVLRIGFGIYQDTEDVAMLVSLLEKLQ